jgi:hypothetical protein
VRVFRVIERIEPRGVAVCAVAERHGWPEHVAALRALTTRIARR